MFLVFRLKGQEITLTQTLAASLGQQYSKPNASVLLEYDMLAEIFSDIFLGMQDMLFNGWFLLQMKTVLH